MSSLSTWDHPDIGDWRSEVANGDTRRSFAEWLQHEGRAGSRPYTVGGKPVVRVVIDVTVGTHTADEDLLAEIGEVLAERLGDNLDAILGVNDLMIDNEVEAWHTRPEPAEGDDVDGDLPAFLADAVNTDTEDVEDVLMEGAE